MALELAKEWGIVTEFVQDEGLRRHMQAVQVAMGAYATRLNGDQLLWEQVGLLHDFDWEIHPDLNQHPTAGAPILHERGYDESFTRIILSHYTEGSGVEREQPVDFALLASDEITGLIIATALVRPSKDIRDVAVKSIRKKWKTRAFAAGVDRDHVVAVTEDFSRACFAGKLDLWAHIENVLEAMKEDAVYLGLDGRLAN